MPSQPLVLCVEPEEEVRSMLRQLLRVNGLESESASTIREAVEKAEGGDFCLYIVADSYQDGANVELIRRLREVTPGVPVLVFSALAFEANRRGAIEAGAGVYLIKPQDVERLALAAVTLCGAAA
ncbi:MAG: response regulator [Acidobacteriota bacterium]|nr:response regulator [Acidobacteriota bacterium]